MKKHILDLGSSTLKLYELDSGSLRLQNQKSVYFKKYLQDGVLAEDALGDLLRFIESAALSPLDLRIYATSFFRKLSEAERARIIERVYSATGHLIQTIDQTTENIFLEIALTRSLKTSERLLIVNVGGGSTELVILENSKKVQSINIDIGVVDILKGYEGINDRLSKIPLGDIVADVRQKLPAETAAIKYAFLTGGELTYMQVAGYPLRDNDIFKDENHPSLIDMASYSQRNGEIFDQVTLAELESFMPENPKWMHGARAYGAIAQAICQQFGIETLIPSDVNIAHGIAHYLWGY